MAGTIRFAVDEDIDERIVRGVLRRNDQIDFLNGKEVGLRNSPDRDVLEWAAQEMRVLLTHDRGTMRAEAVRRVNQKRLMPGLIIIPQEQRFGSYIDQIIDVFTYDDLGMWNDRIEFFH